MSSQESTEKEQPDNFTESSIEEALNESLNKLNDEQLRKDLLHRIIRKYENAINKITTDEAVDKLLAEFLDEELEDVADIVNKLLDEEARDEIRQQIVDNVKSSLKARIKSQIDTIDFAYRVDGAKSIYTLQGKMEEDFARIASGAIENRAVIQDNLVKSAMKLSEKMSKNVSSQETQWRERILGGTKENEHDFDHYIETEYSRVKGVIDRNKARLDENINKMLTAVEKSSERNVVHILRLAEEARDEDTEN